MKSKRGIYLRRKIYRGSEVGSIVLSLALILGLIFLVGSVVLICVQMTAHQKQAQTAADSAVLAVCKEISRLTIDNGKLGRVGLIDEYTSRGLAAKPVLGINTLMARTRLDHIIAKRLGNTTMEFLVQEDRSQLGTATRQLNNELAAVNRPGNWTFTDKEGTRRSINLRQVAADAYNQSGLRPASVGAITQADINVEVGYFRGSTVTNTPVPKPLTRAEVNVLTNAVQYRSSEGDQVVYRSNMPVPVGGSNYIFSAIEDSPKLVDRGEFQTVAAVGPTGEPIAVPTVVRVSINERIKTLVSAQSQAKTEVACATLGNRRITPTAGIFRLEFPQGVPNASVTGVSFETMLSLMNSSMLPVGAGSATPASSSGWNGNGRYFTSRGGPFPGSGSVTRTDVSGRNADNPSVALAFFAYDWLRNEGLRPNVDAVFNAFSQPLRGDRLVRDQLITDASQFLVQPAYAQSANPECNVFGGIFDLVADSDTAMNGSDPRSLVAFNSSTRNSFLDQAMVFRMQASVPQQLGFAPRTTMAYGRSTNDRPITTDGNPISHLLNFRQALIDMMLRGRDASVNGASVAVREAANISRIDEEISRIVTRQNEISAEMSSLIVRTRVVGWRGRVRWVTVNTNPELYNQLQDQWNELENRKPPLLRERAESERRYNRAVTVYYNGANAVNLAAAAANNLLALTSLGVRQVAANHFVVAGTNQFFPPVLVPTESQIEGNGSISTGQAPGASGDGNWVGSPFFLANLGSVAMRNCPNSVIPTSQSRNFKLTTQGDSSKSSDGGSILLSIGDELPIPIKPATLDWINLAGGVRNWTGQIDAATKQNFTQVTGIGSLLEDQLQYQALNVYGVPDAYDSRLTVLWSVMGQNNVRNEDGADARDPDKAGNKLDCSMADLNLDSSQQACRSEATRFQITSPLLRVDMPFPSVEIPPPPPGLTAYRVPTPVPPPPPPPPPVESH